MQCCPFLCPEQQLFSWQYIGVSDIWSSVELKHLYALEAVAETGTFWAAAERLHTSQSSVSDHIAALEALSGQRLVERSRGRRSVALTEAGRLLLGHAHAITARLQAAAADLRAFAAGENGGLRVGVYQSVANKVVPAAMKAFKAHWPGVEVQLVESDDDAGLLDQVEAGELDLTFAVTPLAHPGPFDLRELMDDPYVLVRPAGSSDARPSLRDLDGQDMVGYQAGQTWFQAESYLRSLGIAPRMVFRSNDNGTVQAMVAAGVGVALLPLLAVDETDRRTQTVQPRESIPPRRLAVAWHRERRQTPSAMAFVDLAGREAARIEREHDAYLARAG